MSRCPFWSTAREKVECYKECPILVGESLEGQNGEEQCAFKECTGVSNVSFRDIFKDDYSFFNLSIYEDEKTTNINY